MVIMYKMTPEKKEKYIKKLDKMSEFIDEFKECLEDSEEDVSYRHEDYDDEDYVRVPKSRYARMMKRGKMG
jgi:HSP90 family molecular chaperone